MTKKPQASSESQRKAILAWLREHGTLTTIQARDELGIMHPGGRVLELRKRGYKIVTHWTITIDKAGTKHREAKYVLFTDTIKKAPTSDQTEEDLENE
jgi:hypothetical protein